jgi:hypothetical protein
VADSRIVVSIVNCLATLQFLQIFVQKGGDVEILLENEVCCLISAMFKGGEFYCDDEGEFVGRIHEIAITQHQRRGMLSSIPLDHGESLMQPNIIISNDKKFNARCL